MKKNRGGALLEEEGEKAVPAAELPAGPVQVGTLTEISQALKTGNGVAEVLVGPRLLQNMIRQTVNNIVQARFTKFSPEVNLDIMIDNGVIITGTIKGKWGLIKANIPIELKLGKSFNLVSFNAESKLVDKNEVERELRSVLTQLNNTFRAELAKYDITAAGMENAEIRGEQTFAKFRGKTVR